MGAARRMLILLEVIVLVAPATLLLFLSPIGILAGMGSSIFMSLLLAVSAIAGAFGLVSILHLAAHIIDDSHRLPAINTLIAGVSAGVVACVLQIAFSKLNFVTTAIFGGPVIGAAHLLWMVRGELRSAT
jgi:hypothetical protein